MSVSIDVYVFSWVDPVSRKYARSACRVLTCFMFFGCVRDEYQFIWNGESFLLFAGIVARPLMTLVTLVFSRKSSKNLQFQNNIYEG